MSKYTTELRFICERYAGLDVSEGYDKVDEVIENSVNKIFDFDFPIFDENYRKYLEKKIIKHYYTREIGLETVGLWKLKLNTKMNEIMPYFNQLYKSELIDFNPLFDIDLTREYERKNQGETSGTNANERNSQNDTKWDSKRENTEHAEHEDWTLFNDTPQGGLDGIDSGTYLTTATKNYGENDSNGSEENSGNSKNVEKNIENGSYTGNTNGAEQYIERVKGVYGGISYSKRIKEFRNNMLNIDMMVIDGLKDLFMYLW